MTTGSTSKTLIETVKSVSIVLAVSALGAVTIGSLWVLLGWMRFYGLETGVVAQAVPLDPVNYGNAFLNGTSQVIEWYNGTAQGNARFGSGMGLIAGSCLSLIALRRANLPARTCAVVLAGLITGGRLCLTFTSSPAPFLVCAALMGVLFGVAFFLTREPLPALPRA